LATRTCRRSKTLSVASASSSCPVRDVSEGFDTADLQEANALLEAL
jgi:hypothetical protein